MSVDKITLNGKAVDVELGRKISGADTALTIEGASTLTLTLQDQERVLQKSGVLDHDGNGKLDQQLDVVYDGAAYRLGQVSKSVNTFTLIFGDLIVEVLKSQTGKIATASGTESHIAFARRLVTAAGGEFVTPSKASLPNPTSVAKHTEAQAARDATRGKGIADGAKVTVKGKQASAAQIRMMNVVLSAAEALSPPVKAALALVEACTIENEWSNSAAHNDHDSEGVLQVRVSTAGGKYSPTDVPRVVKEFLTNGFTGRGGAIALAKAHPSWSAGQIAQACQGSQFPDRYDTVEAEAKKILDAYGTLDGSGSADKSTSTRGTTADQDENSWSALQRIAEAQGYRCFAYRNVVYYAREQDLILSRPRMTLSEDTPGVDSIDWEWSPRKKVNVATVTCRVAMWEAPPGSVVVLEDTGPAEGRWLVTTFSRSEFKPDATIELRRGTELLKPEPVTASDTSSTSVTGRAASSAGSTGSGGMDLSGTPKHIIDAYVLPIARANGVNVTPASVDAANAAHGPTKGGNTSDHQGPPTSAWAADLGIGPDIRGGGNASGAAKGDKLAKALAQAFGITWSGSGIANATHDGYRFQVIWRYDSAQAGNHYTHVHFGVKKTS